MGTGVVSRFLPSKDQGPLEREAFREHILSSLWNGISAGIVVLADVILAKTLHAAAWHLTLLVTLFAGANLLSFYWAGHVQGRRKASSFLLAALIGRLPLFALLLWRSTACMLAVNFLFAVGSALLMTSANALFQMHYPKEVRAVRFGVATSVTTGAAILTSLTAGIILQRWQLSFPWLFALAGFAGLLSAYHLYRMEGVLEARLHPVAWLWIGAKGFCRQLLPMRGRQDPIGLRDGLRIAWNTLRENPDFVRFERNFMIYGFAFLGLWPVLPLYIVHDLSMDYRQLSATKGLWAQIGLLVLSPLLGIVLSRLQPLRFTGRTFLLLAGYPLLLLVSTIPGIPARLEWVYASFLVFSVAMAGVNLSWTLSSIHFAGDRDASGFHGLHVALTGVRGLVAPSLGFAVHSVFGTRFVFAYATGLFLLAGILMLRQDRQERRRERLQSSIPVGVSPQPAVPTAPLETPTQVG
jgi:MFS family permease